MTAPGNRRPGPEDTSRPVDLSRYRRGPAAQPPQSRRPPPRQGNWATEVTTSLTGLISGTRARSRPAPEPKARTGSVITVLVLTLTILIAAAVGATYLVWDWIASS